MSTTHPSAATETEAPFAFALDGQDGSARAGRFTTDHGVIETPIFMPVGTLGSVKGVSPRALRSDVEAQIILGNTYHLLLRPGTEVINSAGGLHRFMAWDGPILTDSGGFQVFSLAELRTLSEDGVRFQSHLDGTPHTFTPENVVDTQRAIGSDIMMVLDECPPADVTEAYARESNARTVRWAERCFRRYHETEPLYGYRQALFPIVQGAVYPEIRRESAEALTALDAYGYAIGGLSVGEAPETMYEIVEGVTPHLPADRPRYLMGVGTPRDLIENVARGVDLFDCVMPTRNARNGMLFTTEGILNIKNAKWKTCWEPVDPGLDHYAAQTFTKGYLRHLTLTNEPLFMEIASIQNLSLYLWLMGQMRTAILEGRFEAWRAAWLPRLSQRI